jgi:hypothetical protein
MWIFLATQTGAATMTSIDQNNGRAMPAKFGACGARQIEAVDGIRQIVMGTIK